MTDGRLFFWCPVRNHHPNRPGLRRRPPDIFPTCHDPDCIRATFSIFSSAKENYIMNNLDDLPEMFKAKQVAEIILVSTSQVYKLISTGKLPAEHFGRSVRVRRDDLINFINKHRSNGLADELVLTNE